MIGIVGASLAGLTVARTLRTLGVTDPITLVGAEPWLPYDRPPLSKEMLAAGAGAPPAPDPGWVSLLAPGEADEFGWRLGVSATGVSSTEDGATIHTGAGDVPSRAVVLATGARARRLPGDDLAGVHAVRTLDDARRLATDLASAQHVVVIGAGFIGAEIASTVCAQGRTVSMVETSAEPGVAIFGRQLSDWALDLHRRAGIGVHLDTRVDGFVGDDGAVCGVRLGDGRLLPADVVVVGVGAVPETAWAAGSSVAVDDGFLTDQTGATSVSGIWAAGDCARIVDPVSGASVRRQHWSAAIESARVVAHSVAGVEPPAPRTPYVWSDQHGHRIQICGAVPADADPVVVEGSLAEDAFVAVAGDPEAPAAVIAVDMPRQFTRLRKTMDRQRAVARV